jgi:hypothetical protein
VYSEQVSGPSWRWARVGVRSILVERRRKHLVGLAAQQRMRGEEAPGLRMTGVELRRDSLMSE